MKKLFTILAACLCHTWLWAQTKAGTASEMAERRVWYASPWLWIAGAAFFILALVAFSRDKK